MGDFEKDLRDAFEGVEFTPSEQVWAGVERGLRPRKKGIFFMWQTYGVAATLVFLLTLGYLFRDELFSTGTEDPVKRELTQNKESEGKDGENTAAKTNENNEQSDEPASEKEIPAEKEVPVQDAAPGIRDLQASNDQHQDITNSSDDQIMNLSHSTDQAVNSEVAMINTPQQVEEDSEGLLVDPMFMGPLTLQELKESLAAIQARWELKNLVVPMEIESSEKDLPESISVQQQTSLNGSLGSALFNPNSSLNSSADLALAEQVNDPRFNALSFARSQDQSESQLGSISVGFGVGLPIGQRWVLKTGLRYSQYRFASTSNAYSVENGEELPIYTRVAFDNSEVFLAGEYEITNTLNSISIPAQFGWKFLDLGRFDSWVNIGVAADYMLSHSVKGELNFLEKRQVDFSESNFINRFNLNAITGLEFTYELNPKFALSGEVSFRQFIPVASGDNSSTITPSVLGFGLGINYYLRSKD